MTVPDYERIEVIETPEYLRNVTRSRRTSAGRVRCGFQGIYVVTPSVHGDPKTILETTGRRSATPASTEAYPATTCSWTWRASPVD